MQREHQALADEQADFFDVVGRTDHQLAGLIAVVVAERQALDLGEQFVAEVEGDVLRDALGVKRLTKRKQRPQGCEAKHRDHGRHQRRRGIALIGAQLVERRAEALGGCRLDLRRQAQNLLGREGLHDGVDDALDQLRHHQLRERGDEQRTIGQQRHARIASDVADGAAQCRHVRAARALAAPAASHLSLRRAGGASAAICARPHALCLHALLLKRV